MTPITPTNSHVSHGQDVAAARQSEKTQAKEVAKQQQQGSLHVENTQKSPIPNTSGSWGHVSLDEPRSAAAIENPSFASPIRLAGQKAVYDIMAIMKLLIKMDQQNYAASREMRQHQVNAQVDAIKSQAEHKRKEANAALISHIVKGSIEIGSAAVKAAGSVKGARTLGNPRSSGNIGEMQVRATASQNVQLRWGAAADTLNSGGTFASGIGDYIQKQEQAEQTLLEAHSQKASANISILSEDMQRFWSAIQSILNAVEDIARANSEATKKSYY